MSKRIQKFCSVFTFMFCLSSASSVYGQDDCVTSNESYTDPAGENFRVYDGNGTYLGYVSLLRDTTNIWTAWKDKIGASNEQYNSKEAAASEVCRFER